MAQVLGHRLTYSDLTGKSDSPHPAPTAAGEASGEPGFTLVLGNGRRIETSWSFDDNQLARLIRIVGAA